VVKTYGREFVMQLLSVDACSNAAALRLLEAARTGDVETARTILDARPRLVNCRDVDGRHSTPLHFAAG
ncbi:jg25642, partial [Pararge aegeria aegeria]